MHRMTPGLLTILGLILALLVACGGGTATVTPSAAPSTVPTTAASVAPSAAPTSAASSAPSSASTSPTRTTPSATTPAATATRAASPTTGGPTPKVTGALTIFAASSLTDVFGEMKMAIEAANPGTRLTFNFAASSVLRTQLEQGAKADVFASADTVQMGNAQKSSLIDGDPALFVRNTPVIIVPANNPRGIASIADLAKPGTKLVLATKDVPIGNYARQIVDKASANPAYGSDFGTKALANLVAALGTTGAHRLGGCRAFEGLDTGHLVGADDMATQRFQHRRIGVGGADRLNGLGEGGRVFGLGLGVEPIAAPVRLKIGLHLRNGPPCGGRWWLLCLA